jgi:hypothetical protein
VRLVVLQGPTQSAWDNEDLQDLLCSSRGWHEQDLLCSSRGWHEQDLLCRSRGWHKQDLLCSSRGWHELTHASTSRSWQVSCMRLFEHRKAFGMCCDSQDWLIQIVIPEQVADRQHHAERVIQSTCSLPRQACRLAFV